jgi:hypothetical protein
LSLLDESPPEDKSVYLYKEQGAKEEFVNYFMRAMGVFRFEAN